MGCGTSSKYKVVPMGDSAAAREGGSAQEESSDLAGVPVSAAASSSASSASSSASSSALGASSPEALADQVLARRLGTDNNGPSSPDSGSIIARRDRGRAFKMQVSIPTEEEDDEEARAYNIQTPASVSAQLGGSMPQDPWDQAAPWQSRSAGSSQGGGGGGGGGSVHGSGGNRVILPTIMSDRPSEAESPGPTPERWARHSDAVSSAGGAVRRPPPTPENKLPPPIVHVPPEPPNPETQRVACASCEERDGASASHWASYNGHLRCLELLLESQNEELRVDARGRTALFYAVGQGHYNVTALLLDLRPEWIDQADNKGDTPVHVAACYGQQNVLSLLLESAADPNLRNNRGFTAGHVTGDEPCLGSLIEYGADLMQGDKMGRTPLFCAAATSRMNCVRFLCAMSADFAAQNHGRTFLDTADYRGDTPLHAAVCNNNVECVEILLTHHSEPNPKNQQGLTPLDLATANNFEEVVALLLRSGAMSGTDVPDDPVEQKWQQQQRLQQQQQQQQPQQEPQHIHHHHYHDDGGEAGGGAAAGVPETHSNGSDDAEYQGEWVQVWDEDTQEWVWKHKPKQALPKTPDAGAAHARARKSLEEAKLLEAAEAATAAAAAAAAAGKGGGDEEADQVGDLEAPRSGSKRTPDPKPLISPSSQLKAVKEEFSQEKKQRRKTEESERLRQQAKTLARRQQAKQRRASRAGNSAEMLAAARAAAAKAVNSPKHRQT
eukprot:g4873.t1